MSIELIGIVTFALGPLVLWYGAGCGLYALVVSTLLGAAAAVKLPALGDASILPANIILLFYLFAVANSAKCRTATLRLATGPNAGYWFSALVIYAVLTAYFLPRAFAGMTEVYSVARGADDELGTVVSLLAPRASNLTQSAYYIGDLLCFLAIGAHAAVNGALNVAKAILVAAVVNLAFAGADLITYATGTGEMLDVIRNANYRMLNDGEIGGLKRIVGSFSEASSYGYATLGFFAFALELWLRGIWTWVAGAITALLLATLVVSTSSSTYVALGGYGTLLVARCAYRQFQGRATHRSLAVVVAVPSFVLILVLGLMLVPSVWAAVTALTDATLVNKLSSQSGVERTQWNMQALKTFSDTAFMGAGLGSVRASSFATAVLSNIGIAGVVLVFVFLIALFIPVISDRSESRDAAVHKAGASAAFILLLAACVSGTSVSLTLLFSIFAGVAAAPQAKRIRQFLPHNDPAHSLGKFVLPMRPARLT